ncbi:putative beta-lysine N-acetyltransferase [bacterium]|jgi:beta-lysine N6-acetyltransferase|nr:putative beta-lysine N-acetyltransferase [bacterium]
MAKSTTQQQAVSGGENGSRLEEDEHEKIHVSPVTESSKPGELAVPADEWGGLEPTEKKMGMVSLVLDKGVKTTVVGTIYGMDFEIEGDNYKVDVYLDYYNRRLKILDYEVDGDFSPMLERLAYLAEANDFEKIFVKASPDDFQNWITHGYLFEGILRYFYKGKDSYVLSRFSTSERLHSSKLLEEVQLVERLIYKTPLKSTRELDPDIEITQASKDDIPELVLIYRDVFETYPSPLTNPDYISATMDRNVIYQIARVKGESVAAASAEISVKHSNAEMTDCATVASAQGRGIMQHLLMELEKDLKKKGIMTAYTLARAPSFGMNCAFFRLGYEFSGRLINNCDIFGHYEDMNIWVKRLDI